MTDKKMIEISLSEDDAKSLCVVLADSTANVSGDVREQIREQIKEFNK